MNLSEFDFPNLETVGFFKFIKRFIESELRKESLEASRLKEKLKKKTFKNITSQLEEEDGEN